MQRSPRPDSIVTDFYLTEPVWRRNSHEPTSITDGGSVSGDRKLKESTPRLAPGRPQPPTMGSLRACSSAGCCCSAVYAALRRTRADVPYERRDRPCRERFLQAGFALREGSFVLPPLGEQSGEDICARRDGAHSATDTDTTSAG
jgi:hypothetical protein